MHDVVVRLAWRVFDSLLVVPMRAATDPTTGETRMVVVNENVIETGHSVIIGTPQGDHYTAVEWSDDVWDQISRAHVHEFLNFYYMDYFAPQPGTLRTALAHEAELVRAAGPNAGAGWAPDATADAVAQAPYLRVAPPRPGQSAAPHRATPA